MSSAKDPSPADPGPPADGSGGLVGSVLSGRYRIEKLIGTGGMGAVYQAEHTHMHKRLAVKVLHAEMSRLPEVVARFEREAMAAAHIEHPNVAAATDFGKLEDGSFFLVLEYVEGRSLREAIDQGAVELGRACHIARQMAGALGRAHTLGIVHRDLKPENVMLVAREGDADFVKVLDFGIAKVPMGAFTSAKGSGEVLTQLGMVYGTPEYMAPEQALGQEVDARADLYSLGVILFEMLTGKRPFEHSSKVTLLGMHVTAPIPRMRERTPDADIPEDLDTLVMRLLAKEATARFHDAREFIDALDVVTSRLMDEGRIAGTGAPESQVSRSSRIGKRSVSPEPSLALGPTSLAQPAASSRGLPNVVVIARESLTHALRRAPPWVTPRVAAIGGAGVVVVLGFLVMTSSHGGASRQAKSHVPGVLARVVGPSMDDRVTEASTKVERGDYASAIDALLALEKEDGDRADVHRLLEHAYMASHDVHGALREAVLWIGTDDTAGANLKLEEDVRNAALQHDTQDDAFTLLESKMGAHGIDLLYDLAYGTSGRQYPQAASRARHSLEVDDVHGRASPALQVLMDFRAAKTCDAKLALLERARQSGDARMVATLQPYQATKGCGFFGITDCYPCLHRGTTLKDTISALTDRTAPAP